MGKIGEKKIEEVELGFEVKERDEDSVQRV